MGGLIAGIGSLISGIFGAAGSAVSGMGSITANALSSAGNIAGVAGVGALKTAGAVAGTTVSAGGAAVKAVPTLATIGKDIGTTYLSLKTAFSDQEPQQPVNVYPVAQTGLNGQLADMLKGMSPTTIPVTRAVEVATKEELNLSKYLPVVVVGGIAYILARKK